MSKIDRAGSVVSLACAVHCAAMPLVVTFLPMLGLSFLANSWFDVAVLLISGTMATIAGVHGYERHKCIWVPLLFWAAIGTIMVGVMLHFKSAGIAEAMHRMPWAKPCTDQCCGDSLCGYTMPIGGVTLFVAHLLNIKLSKACKSCPDHGKTC
jgi:hypothetical protein